MTMTTEEQARVHIRWLIRRDMPEVLQIEASAFDSPWTENDFLRCLRELNCIGMVAEHGERIVGFMIYQLHEKRFRLLNFAVHHRWQRLGVGRQMVAKLVAKLSPCRRTRLTVIVRESNLPAQLFFRSQGFRASKVLRGYFDDSGEDAYVFAFDMNR